MSNPIEPKPVFTAVEQPQPAFETKLEGEPHPDNLPLDHDLSKEGATSVTFKQTEEGGEGSVKFQEKPTTTETSHKNVWQFILDKGIDPKSVRKITPTRNTSEGGGTKFGVYQHKRERRPYQNPTLAYDNSGKLIKITKPSDFEEDTPFRLSADVSWDIEYTDKQGQFVKETHKQTVFLGFDLPRDPSNAAAVLEAKERALLQLRVYEQIMQDPLEEKQVNTDFVNQVAKGRLYVPVPTKGESIAKQHKITYEIGEGSKKVTKAFELHNPSSEKNKRENIVKEAADVEIENWTPEVLANLKKMDTVVLDGGTPPNVQALYNALVKNNVTPEEFAKHILSLTEGKEEEFNQANLFYTNIQKPWKVQKWVAQGFDAAFGAKWAQNVLKRHADAKSYAANLGKIGSSISDNIASVLKFWDKEVYGKKSDMFDVYGFNRTMNVLKRDFKEALKFYNDELEEAESKGEKSKLVEAREKLDKAFKAIEAHQLVAELSSERIASIKEDVENHADRMDVVFAFALAKTLVALGDEIDEIFEDKELKKIEDFRDTLKEGIEAENIFAQDVEKLVKKLNNLPLKKIEKSQRFIEKSAEVTPENLAIFSARQQVSAIRNRVKKTNVSESLKKVNKLFNSTKNDYEATKIQQKEKPEPKEKPNLPEEPQSDNESLSPEDEELFKELDNE